MEKKSVFFIFSILLILFCIVSCNQNKKPETQTRAEKNIYDENADARADITRAIEQAQQNGKNILLMFGGNWCSWCHRLHTLSGTRASVFKIMGAESVEYRRSLISAT